MSGSAVVPASLMALVERLLVGTGIDPADAAAVASGDRAHDGPVAEALREGWSSSKPVRP